MGKNYWHIFALSATVSLITISLNNYIIACLFFIWLFYLYFINRLSKSIVVFTILCFIFFYFYIPSPTANAPSHLDDEHKIFNGEIISSIIETDKKIEFMFKEEQFKKPMLVLYFIQDDDDIKEHLLKNISYGAACQISGNLSIPDGARNPHQFDYQLYLLKKGISHQIIVSSLNEITCTETDSWLKSIYTIRSNLLNITSNKLHKETAAWLQALVLGYDNLIEEEIIEVFQRWSLSHILAISGLHIGIVVAILYLILVRFSITTKEKAQIFVMVFLPIYAILAGSQPSVWRASLMIVFVILLNKIKLKYSYTDILSIVFLLLMIVDKYIAYHIGFQLSFAVTFGLILSRNWLAQSATNIERIFQISFVSQMMILPLQIHYFFIFQPLSIIINLIIVPYFSLFVIPTMFILLICITLPKWVIHPFEKVFLKVNDVVLDFIFFIDQHANYPLIIGEMSLYFTIIYYLIFICMMIYLEKRKKLKSFQYGMMLTLLLVFMAARPYLSPVGTVTMLDIGQGDAYVIELPYRKGVFFIDAGASFTFPNLDPTDKVYKQIIKPYLYGQGIQKIDAIFISHDDLDHIGSVKYMIEELQVDELIISQYHSVDELYGLEWKNAGVLVNRISFNDTIVLKDQAFHVLSPRRDKNDANENSLVLYTELGGLAWIFTGDIGKETEKEIMNSFKKLSVDVLKVAHHGSNTSTDPEFIEWINPSFAFISAGVNNRYGHPTKEVIETLLEQDIVIYRTDVHGAVQYKFKDDRGLFYDFIKMK